VKLCLGHAVTLVGAFALAGCARSATKSTARTTPPPPAASQETFGGALAELRASALPTGKMSNRPTARPPGDIRYNEQLPPFLFVVAYDMPHVTTLKNPDVARPHIFTDSDERAAYCVTANEDPTREGPLGGEWSGATSTWAQAPNTEAVHAERLDDKGDGSPTLTILDAWVDGTVKGMRPILRRTIPLKRLGEAGGVKAYAFHDVRDDGKSFVQVVVSRPPVRRGSVGGAPFIVGLPNGETTDATCTHVRVALPLIAGDSMMASVDIAVEVPAESFAMPNGEVVPSRARRMRVNVSTMWLARDRDATVDARMVWIGAEQSRIEMRGIGTRQPTIVRNVRGDME
jgi:hypothetical protein